MLYGWWSKVWHLSGMMLNFGKNNVVKGDVNVFCSNLYFHSLHPEVIHASLTKVLFSKFSPPSCQRGDKTSDHDCAGVQILNVWWWMLLLMRHTCGRNRCASGLYSIVDGKWLRLLTEEERERKGVEQATGFVVKWMGSWWFLLVIFLNIVAMVTADVSSKIYEVGTACVGSWEQTGESGVGVTRSCRLMGRHTR